MNMTLSEYIKNPMGAKNAVLNSVAREAIRTKYIKSFDAIMLREHGRLDYKLVKNDKKNRYYAWFKIPSETVEKFYYDVVLEFYTDNNVEGTGSNLFDYNVRFFSNDPAFAYTYAYVFYHNNLFIDELKSRMSKISLKTPAKEKNPYNQIGYVKTLYFAYLAMQNRKLNLVDKFIAECDTNMTISTIVSGVADTENKIQDRQEAGEKLKKKKKPRQVSNPVPNSNRVSSAKNSLGIKKTGTIGKTKTVKSGIVKTKRK